MDMKLWIRLARKKAGLTQEQLGERLGVTKANVSAWENGRHEASFAQLTAISELAGLPLGGGDAQAVDAPGTIEKWQQEDAARLKTLFESRKASFSQEEFGTRFDIGSQGMVWQYLNGRRPLNIKAAAGFARGLGVEIDEFSPRLANEIRRAASSILDTIPSAPDTAAHDTIGTRLTHVMAEEKLDIPSLAKLLGVESAVVRAWIDLPESKLGLHHAVRLQEAYAYSPIWLVSGKGEPKLTSHEEAELDEPSIPLDLVEIPPGSFRKIPVVGMAQLGDNGHFCDIEYPVGHGDGYISFPTSDPDAYALRCNGDSMRPRIKHGEFVVIEPNRSVTNGDEVLVKSQDGRVMVKELAYVRDSIVHLSSVNERHGMLRIPQDQIERMHFVGGIVKPAVWRPD